MGLVSSNYSVGWGSASGQVSVLDNNGNVVTYADSMSDAEDVVETLNNQETQTTQTSFPFTSMQLFEGYLAEKERGYKGNFKRYKTEVRRSWESPPESVYNASGLAQRGLNEDAGGYSPLFSGGGTTGNATIVDYDYNQAVLEARQRKALIESATAQELLDGNDNPEFMSREKHLRATKAVGDSQIMRCFASTIELRTKSEKFTSNQTYYRQWVLLRDFNIIARDKKIPMEQAIDYSLNFGDVNVRCSCPSMKFHGFNYLGTELGYLYGLPREGRFPKVRNPDLQNVICKHLTIALEHLKKNKEKIIHMFATYYKRLDETPEDTMIAIPASAVEEDEFGEEARETAELLGEELPPPYSTEPEVISDKDPETGAVVIDTKMAEGLLPPEQQVKYAGDEDKPKDEALLDTVADSVSDEEVQELEEEIDNAGSAPRSDDERYVNEWSFQRLNMLDDEDEGYTVLLSASDRASLITSGKEDFKGREAFLNSLAGVLRRFGYPEGTHGIDKSCKVWTFWEGVPHASQSVFTLTLLRENHYRYWYNLGGVEQRGVIDGKPIEILSRLP